MRYEDGRACLPGRAERAGTSKNGQERTSTDGAETSRDEQRQAEAAATAGYSRLQQRTSSRALTVSR